MDWTIEQVMAMAPDAGSAKSARELASARKWQATGRSDTAAWGECQGSGALPYQTQIELSGPTFKCTCPSRKFPCKHGLGLLLLIAASPDLTATEDPPAWVVEWLRARASKAEQKADRAKAAAPPDEAQASKASPSASKSEASRLARVTDGIDGLDLWLRDILRNGLAELPSRPASFFRERASRLIDSQAPGLAAMVGDLGSAVGSGRDWQERSLERIALLYLAMEGLRNAPALPPSLLAGVRSAIGWTQTQEQVMAGPALEDTWLVAGRRSYEENDLIVQRVWLVGLESRRWALVLTFSHRNQARSAALPTGSVYRAEAAFYDAPFPIRAVLTNAVECSADASADVPFGSVCDAIAAYSCAVANCPWIEVFPLAVEGLVPVRDNGRWHLREGDRVDARQLPVRAECDASALWRLAAYCGGRPSAIACEWDGRAAMPLSVMAGGRMTQLH